MTTKELTIERNNLDRYTFNFTSIRKQRELIELRDEVELTMYLARVLPSNPSVITSK